MNYIETLPRPFPQTADHGYGSQGYWEERYQREVAAGTTCYEWYIEYRALRSLLNWHVPKNGDVLQVLHGLYASFHFLGGRREGMTRAVVKF